MSWRIYKRPTDKAEVEEMLKQLTPNNHAVSTLAHTKVLGYAKSLGYRVSTHKRPDGNVEVWLKEGK